MTLPPRIEARIPRACFSSADATFLREPTKLALPVRSSVAGAVQAPSQQSALLTAKSSSVLLGKLDVDSVRFFGIEVRSPCTYHQEPCSFLSLDAASEMTSFTPLQWGCRAEQVRSGTNVVLFRDRARPHVRPLGRSLVGVCKPYFVGGFFPVSSQHCLMGAFTYTTCMFTHCRSDNLHWCRPKTCRPEQRPTPVARVHPHFAGCALSVLGKSSRLGGCPSHLVTKTLTCFGVEILTILRSRHTAGNVWTTREEACSLPIPLASGVTQCVEHIMPALQTQHTREGELRCAATEIVQEPGTSSEVFVIQDRAKQHAFPSTLAQGGVSSCSSQREPVTSFGRFSRTRHSTSRSSKITTSGSYSYTVGASNVTA